MAQLDGDFTRPSAYIATILFLTLAITPSALAQVPDPTIAASAPIPGSGHHYIGSGTETVSPADGLLSFDLPIQTAGGRQLSFPFGFRYSSSEQYYLSTANGGAGLTWIPRATTPYEVNGWSYDLPILTGTTGIYQHYVYRSSSPRPNRAPM